MSKREQSKLLRREESRARMLVRTGLGMFPGVPIRLEAEGIRWQSVPAASAPKSICVQFNPGVLQDVERTLQALEHQYARHMDRVIDQPGDWLPRIRQVLDLLKSKASYSREHASQSARSGAQWLAQLMDSMPVSKRWCEQALPIVHKHPQLAELVSQLAFLQATQHRPTHALLNDLLQWSEQLSQLVTIPEIHVPPELLSTDPLPLPLHITLISNSIDARWLSLLFKVLLDPNVSGCPSQKPLEYVFRLAKQLKMLPAKNSDEWPVRSSEPSLGEMIASHLRWLGTLSAGTVRPLTHILAELTDDYVFANMQALVELGRREEKRLVAEIHVARSLGPRRYLEQIGIAEHQTRARVKKIYTKPELMLTRLCELAPTIVNAATDKSSLRHCIELLHYTQSLSHESKLALLRNWFGPTRCSAEPVNLSELLPLIKPTLKHSATRSRWLWHWKQCYKPKQKGEATDAIRLVYNYKVWSATERASAIGVMNRVIVRADGNVRNEILYAAAQLLPHAHEAAALERYLLHCAETGSSPLSAYTTIHLAFRLTDDATRIEEHTKKIASDDAYQSALQNIFCMKLDSQIMGLVQRLASDGQTAHIIKLAYALAHFEAFVSPLPTSWVLAANTDWVKSYPEALHRPLLALAEIAPQAEAIAERMLSVHFRSPDKVRQEMQAIEATLSRLEQSGDESSLERHRKLTIRRENLQSRLTGSYELSSVRTARLQRELLERRDLEWVERIEKSGLEIVGSELQEYGISELPARLIQSPYNRILPGIANLPKEQRRLAIRGLATGWNNTLELTREAANERFLQQMAGLGVHVQPWLDPEFRLQGRCENGETYTVAFTCDPLEILMMGSHFDTCLSTHAVNFFSTIANLVDVNKRVLYGHTDDGRVVGRCLFALTNDGAIQTYHRYSHNREDNFQEMVSLFAFALAERMGTRLCDNGKVSCLVSRRWYDDGAIETANSFRSRLRRTVAALHECDSDRAYDVCLQHLGSHDEIRAALEELTESTLYCRQALAKSWYPKFGQDPDVNPRVRLILAAHVFALGERESAFRVFDSLPAANVPRMLGRKSLYRLLLDVTLMDMLIAYDPRLARRWIRSSRLTGIQCDADETLAARRVALEQITEILSGRA